MLRRTNAMLPRFDAVSSFSVSGNETSSVAVLPTSAGPSSLLRPSYWSMASTLHVAQNRLGRNLDQLVAVREHGRRAIRHLPARSVVNLQLVIDRQHHVDIVARRDEAAGCGLRFDPDRDRPHAWRDDSGADAAIAALDELIRADRFVGEDAAACNRADDRLSAEPGLALCCSSPPSDLLRGVPSSVRTTMPTCVGGTVADGTTNSLSLIMRSWTSDFGHSAQVTSLVERISPGLMVRDATSTFATPFGFSSWTTTGCACFSRNTLTRNAAAPARTKAMTASMMTDGLMEKPAPLPTKNSATRTCVSVRNRPDARDPW